MPRETGVDLASWNSFDGAKNVLSSNKRRVIDENLAASMAGRGYGIWRFYLRLIGCLGGVKGIRLFQRAAFVDFNETLTKMIYFVNHIIVLLLSVDVLQDRLMYWITIPMTHGCSPSTYCTWR